MHTLSCPMLGMRYEINWQNRKKQIGKAWEIDKIITLSSPEK